MKTTLVCIVGCISIISAEAQLSIGDKKEFMLEDEIQRAKHRAHNGAACAERVLILNPEYSDAELEGLPSAIGRTNGSGTLTPIGVNGCRGLDNQFKIHSGTNSLVDVEIPWGSPITTVFIVTEARGVIRSGPDQFIVNRVEVEDPFDWSTTDGDRANNRPSVVRLRVPSGSVQSITTVSDMDRVERVVPSCASRSVSAADRVVSSGQRLNQGSGGPNVGIGGRR